jgi:hypothetical protein
MQLNMQHSRTATDNLMNLTRQDKTDKLLIQEPYLIKNKQAGNRTGHIHPTKIRLGQPS